MNFLKKLFPRKSRGDDAEPGRAATVRERDPNATVACAPNAPSSPTPASVAEARNLDVTNAGPAAVPSPRGEGQGEGELKPSGRQSAQIKVGRGTPRPPSPPSPTSPPLPDAPCPTPHAHSLLPDPDNKRNGKIARLPRDLRDQINQCLFAGQSAVSIARHLNQMPEVKAILQTFFDGRPISQQNLSEWKAGGYHDWLLRQELLLKQKELAADVKELGQIAENMGDSLMGMLLLDYTRLHKNAQNETPEEFEKKRKALSAQIQDIVKLRRCELQARSVEVQEGRLEQDREKTQEEVHGKFMEWAQHPAIRRTFFLKPQARDAQMRAYHKLPPTPEDEALLRELGLRKRKKKQGTQTEQKPSQPEKPASASESRPSGSDPTSEPRASGSDPSSDSNRSRGPSRDCGDDEALTSPSGHQNLPPVATRSNDNSQPVAVPSPWGEGQGEGELKTEENQSNPTDLQPSQTEKSSSAMATPYDQAIGDGKSHEDAIAVLVGEPTEESAPMVEQPPSQSPSTINHQPSTKILTPPKPPISAYQKAISEGKSHEEAMAVLFCGPAERQRRIREHEEYRKALAAYEAQQAKLKPACPVIPASALPSQLPPPPPQPNCDSPLGEIHHPSDRWKARYT